MRNDVFYHAQAAYRLGDCKRGKFIFVLADRTGIEREAQTIEAYLTRIAAEYADSLTNIFDTPVVRFVASGRYDVIARWEDGHITLQATSSGTDYTRHGKMARNREVRVDDCKSFVDALRKASNRSRLVCKAIGADMMTYARLLELFAKRPEDSSWCEFSPSADVWPNAADTQSEDVEAATVEEDTRDVSEIITEANKKYLGGKGVLYRVPAYHDAIVYVTPSNRWVGYSVADGYEQWNHDPRAAAELPWDKTLQELEAAGLIVQCFEELDIPPYVTAYELEDYGQSQEVSRLTEEAGWEFDGGMIMRPVASDDTTETVVGEPVEVEHDGVVDVELAETSETIPVVEAETAEAEPDGYGQYVGMWTRGNERVCVCADGTVWAHFDHPDDAYESWVRQDTLYGVDAFVCETFADRGWVHVSCEADGDVPRYVTNRDAAVPGTVCADDAANGWRYDGLSAVIRDYADVPTPRAVESEPVLPAECNAVTQEIPEVPPQTNEDAQVLQVSEHVIPACVTLKEYELTRDVPRKRRREFRDSRGRKCAYVVRADDGAFILWRSWYKHEDAEMDAAVRAYYAQVA